MTVVLVEDWSLSKNGQKHQWCHRRGKIISWRWSLGLMAGGREKSMDLMTARRLARMKIIVLTSLTVLEIMFGMGSLKEMILSFALPAPGCGVLQPAAAVCSSDRRL